jgi:hypothetical protein
MGGWFKSPLLGVRGGKTDEETTRKKGREGREKENLSVNNSLLVKSTPVPATYVRTRVCHSALHSVVRLIPPVEHASFIYLLDGRASTTGQNGGGEEYMKSISMRTVRRNETRPCVKKNDFHEKKNCTNPESNRGLVEVVEISMATTKFTTNPLVLDLLDNSICPILLSECAVPGLRRPRFARFRCWQPNPPGFYVI